MKINVFEQHRYSDLGAVLGRLGIVLGGLGADMLRSRGGLGAILGGLGAVSGRSWGILGTVLGGLRAVLEILGRSGAKMLIFHWFRNGLAAHLARHNRQRGSGPKPWRG